MKTSKLVLVSFFVAAFAVGAMAGEGVLKVYVTRHAQRGPRAKWPEADRDAVMIGEMIDGVRRPPAGDSITPLGARQAEALGRQLAKLGFAGRIYSSPNFRTMQTAVTAAMQLSTNVVVVPEPLMLNASGHANPGNSPKLEELQKRFPGRVVAGDPLEISRDENGKLKAPLPSMKEFFEAFLARHGEGEFLLVGHSSSLPQLLAAIEDHIADDSLKLARSVANCCLFYFEFDASGTCIDSDIYNEEFLPPEMLTSNFGPGKSPPRRAVKSAGQTGKK